MNGAELYLPGSIWDSVLSGKLEVLDYVDSKKIKIKFLNTGNVRWVRADKIKNGHVRDPDVISGKLQKGDIIESNTNGRFVVVNVMPNKATVRFLETDAVVTAEKANLLAGKVCDPLKKTVCGIGYLGYSKHSKKLEPAVRKRIFQRWTGMMRRCYDKSSRRFKNYKDCSVAEVWHSRGAFTDWCWETNPKGLGQLDKDMRVSGNRVYSPETCMWVTNRLNSVLHAPHQRYSTPRGVLLVDGIYRFRVCDGNGGFIGKSGFVCMDSAWVEYCGAKLKVTLESIKQAVISNELTTENGNSIYDRVFEVLEDEAMKFDITPPMYDFNIEGATYECTRAAVL